ncbi:drug/metabolite transporter (DMT)-like permease [Enterococcus sp. PF1-24]|uniref:DMT family transporter n=1 Tax=unclassified Enterococcus TaxID=2608891 RepID=UPI0024767A93|nr:MULTISPECIES: DMT family transporter [unclassified Enterococcus]MDH6364627.1 drug/metabolite transporter (DMT)-like permease [Enterococcus sp. PFB1-1]MDH6401728.1 drug/metabolite transporter (DMT)-like permease [Enterococcus sp. PF1-24]
MNQKNIKGHLTAIFTIFVWGTTFVSTKKLLAFLQPIEILFLRFFIGYFTLWLLKPKVAPHFSFKKEKYFMLAGITGITLYYLCENVALLYTSASNLGVIVSVAPFFTALFAMIFFKEKKPTIYFMAGFVMAIIGIAILSFAGSKGVSFNPLGDFLGLMAAVIWAIYSIITKKISEFKVPIILATRKVFAYGLLFMLPVLFFSKPSFDLTVITQLAVLTHLLYLAIGASAICFVTWSFTINTLGAVRASVYIYGVPVVTIIASVLFLNETLTSAIAIGTLFTLAGLLISEKQPKEALQETIE